MASAGGMSALLFLGQTAPLLANPTGGNVIAGSATMGAAGATLTVSQATQSAIINWQTFSIANGETTKFIVPNSTSATLNRVIGGNPSAIYGNLQSNGILYLVNPSGIVVGPSGRIDTASFLASTLDVSNEQFLAGGNMEFAGNSGAGIKNAGTIHASTGDVYLIADQVNNSGKLSAKHGTVGLAAGTDVLYQQAGNEHLFVKSTPAGATRATGVTNSGTIRAAAAELTAAGGNAYALAINNTGVIAATGYKKIHGQVYLTSDGGSISNSGKISAKQANGNGGKIVINGTAKKSTTSGVVTNSGTINASATVAKGAGGTVSIKNMGGTTVNTASGQILATGGTGGAGGKIETSGGSLQIGGMVSAGKGGSWLLDPTDVTIDNGSGVAPDVNVTTLEIALDGGTSETVQAVGGTTDSGNIDLDVPLVWTSGATLQLTATGNINLTKTLTGTSGTLSLSAGGTISDTADLAVGNFILQGGSWSQNTTTLPTFTVSGSFALGSGATFLRVIAGNGGSAPYEITDVYGLQGMGSTSLLGDNFELANNIDATGTALWNPDDAPTTGAGFVSIGNSTTAYGGTFSGLGFTINGLYIDAPNANVAGLFGETGSGAVLSGVALTNVNVTGSNYVGGLVGYNAGAVDFTSTTGTVGTSANLTVSQPGSGGLVGYNVGIITDSYSTVDVSGTYALGGLVGNEEGGSISETYASGTVTAGDGANGVGGLVGTFAGGGISDSYSTGAVSAGTDSEFVGGLAGSALSVISNSYTTSAVTAGGGSSFVGGLAGGDSATLSGGNGTVLTGTFLNTFWDTTTAGLSVGIGDDASNPGVTAATTSELMSQTFILANSSAAPPWDFSSTWTTNGGTTTPQLIALASSVGTTDDLSGLVYTNDQESTLAAAGLTISLLSDGTVLLTTTTGPGGTFSFDVSSTVLNGGVLLTDATDNGNTYYQANVPASNITSVNIIGGALSILADTASNAALATAAGAGRGNGVNFTVVGSALSTMGTGDIDMISNYYKDGVISQYTLDGNVTAGGLLSINPQTNLTGSANVTLSGANVEFGATFDRTGSLSVVSGEDIDLINVGTLSAPSTAPGISLNAAGTIYLYNSYIATAGGNFSATGTGDANIPNGVEVANSVIDSQGGSISLTGTSTTYLIDQGEGILSGVGVYVDNSILETASATDTQTTGNITINGTGSASDGGPLSVLNDLIGTEITNSIVTVVNGALSVTGDVNSGTSFAVLNDDGGSNLTSGYIFGVLSNDGSLVTASGTGSVNITGNTTGSVAQLFNTGVDLSGLDSDTGDIANSFVSVAGGTTGLTIMGTAGTVANSPAGANVQTPSTIGVTIEFGANVTASGTAPITITGFGGSDENDSDAGLNSEASLGISVNAISSSGSGGTPDVSISSENGTITLNGTAGDSIGNIAGISVNSEGGATASIASTSGNISLTGTAPEEGPVVQVLSPTGNGGAAGVDISGDSADGSLSNILAYAGSIYIKGTVSSGTANTKEAGVFIHDGANIAADGTGGTAGATAQGDVSIFGNTSGSTAQALSGGVFIGGSETSVSASGLVADGTGSKGLTINGTSSTIDGSTGATLDEHDGSGGVAIEPLTAGIVILDGAGLSTAGAAPITLNGTGGTNASTANSDTGYVSATDGGNSASYGVAIFTPVAGLFTSVAAGGQLTVMGTAGSSPIDGTGVTLGGSSNAGFVSVMSGAGISITGTGGAGNAETNVPNAGVSIFDPGNNSGSVNITASGGNVSITGTSGGGSNSTGINGGPYFDTVDNQPSFDPSVTASASIVLVSDSGLINNSGFAGGINAQSTSVTAPVGTDSTIVTDTMAGPLSLNGGDFTVNVFPYTAITLGASNVTSLDVNSNGGLTITGPIDSSGPVTLVDGSGDITFAANGSIDSTGGNVIVAAGNNLADSHYIINDSSLGANAIQASGGNIYLFSSDPTSDVFGGITVQPSNMVFDATFGTDDLPPVNEELFYADAGATGPNPPTNPVNTGSTTPPSTMTGGAAGGQSNIVPPALTPTVTQVTTTTNPVVTSGGDTSGTDGGSQPPPLSFTGTGISTLLGETDGGLADASSNSGQVGSGDAAQLGGGGLGNVANPQAAGALNQALGPIVYQNLADALKALGDWADVPDESNSSTASDSSSDGETILTGGDVAEMTGAGVKNIPINQAPVELRNAMNGDILTDASH